MEVVGIEEILPVTANSSASFNTDFVLPHGASGVEVYVTTSDKLGSPSWTFGLSTLTPAGTAVSKITSAAVANSNTTTRVAILPGVVAVNNAIANDVAPGKCRLVATTSDNANGYQIVDVGGAKVGGSATGLANDATVYTASVAVDGVANAITVTGSAAQTYTTLLAAINADLTGATATLSSGNIKITSAATGGTSTIAITDTDLFATLTDYSSILSAVAGQSYDLQAYAVYYR